MTKSPSFQFYPSDWVSGSPATMTPDETHLYLWLLCKDWLENGFVFDVPDLARWSRLPRPRLLKAWAKVGKRFEEREGRFYNPRLDRERAKQAEWRRKSSEGGRASAEHRWGNGGGKGAYKGGSRVVEPPHQPNGNTSVFSLQSSDPVTTTTAAAVAEAAIELTRTANAAIAARFGEQPLALRAGHGPSHELAQAIIEAGVPFDFALREVARQAALLKEPCNTMGYFRKGILREWAKRQNPDNGTSLVNALLAPPTDL